MSPKEKESSFIVKCTLAGKGKFWWRGKNSCKKVVMRILNLRYHEIRCQRNGTSAY